MSKEQHPAVAIIEKMAAEGNSAKYIAEHLNRNRVPTISGRGRWVNVQVVRLCEKHNIAKPVFDPAKIAATQAANTPIKVDTITPPGSARPSQLSDIDTRDTAITQYADEMGMHRWLVAQAVEDFERHLDELALWIEHGPQEPDPTGDDDADRIAHKEARRVWMNHESEEAQLRDMIAGKDDVTAVELIFVWSCERIDHHAAMAHARTTLEANYSTPEREELRKRHEARNKLYRAAEPKRSETLGELVTKAERAMRARRAAMAQAAGDYRALNQLPAVLFDDLRKSLEREQGPTGTAANALRKAEKTWRYRRQQAAELGAATTIGALRNTKATTEDDAEVA